MPQEIRDGRRCGMTDTHTEHEWCCYHASFDERMTVVAATREQAAVLRIAGRSGLDRLFTDVSSASTRD